MKYALFLSIAFLTSCGTTQTKQFLSDFQYALISNGYSRIACAKAIKEPCGLTLYSCSDGLIYMCAQNVAIFDLKAFKPTNKASEEL